MGAELWNAANKLLKERGIRQGRKTVLRPDTLDDAWRIYCEKKLQANQHKMGSASDDWIEAA